MRYGDVWQRYNSVLSKLNIKRDKIVGIQAALATADINKDSRIDFEELRHDLKMCVAYYIRQVNGLNGGYTVML